MDWSTVLATPCPYSYCMTTITIAERLTHLRELTQSGEARAIRERARLALSDIGQSIGADPSAVGRWERGERLPRGDVALRYARLLERLSKASVRSGAA
jgi:DNA-binding transcriptional regulator YiaG